jgi:glycosyltransferase involved in cell wall biosynthesis
MRISVLVGTRNRDVALRRCLASIAAQDDAPHEVIVLDDASDTIRVADVAGGINLPLRV